MFHHSDAKLAYFPRCASRVVPRNLPMGTWRDFETPFDARRSRDHLPDPVEGCVVQMLMSVGWSLRRAAANAAVWDQAVVDEVAAGDVGNVWPIRPMARADRVILHR